MSNNDLISREALKNEFRAIYHCAETMEELANTMEDAIDNAQPVEPFEPDYVGAERLKARQRGYEEGYHNGMKIGKTLNPQIKQGEKIKKKPYGWLYCSKCDHLLELRDNFCWFCGADMRKGGAE